MKQVWWPPLWFLSTRDVFNCACVYEFREVCIRGARRFYFVGALLFRDNVQTHLGGASIRGGASDRDITVILIECVIFKLILVIDMLRISCKFGFIDDNSTLAQAMAWCHQAPSHYLNSVMHILELIGSYEHEEIWL